MVSETLWQKLRLVSQSVDRKSDFQVSEVPQSVIEIIRVAVRRLLGKKVRLWHRQVRLLGKKVRLWRK